MSKENESAEERLLVERLRREAIESRPAFSESLHQRIVRAVEQRRATVAEDVKPVVSRRWSRGLATALAAACLLCAVVIGWQLVVNASRQDPAPIARASLTDLPSIDDLTDPIVRKIDGLTVSVALEPHATHLEHDAQAVADVLLDRLPRNVKLVDNQ
jgi:hypothetical protein